MEAKLKAAKAKAGDGGDEEFKEDEKTDIMDENEVFEEDDNDIIF